MSQKITCPNCKTEIDLDKLADEKYSEIIKNQELKLKEEQEKQKEIFEKELEAKTIEMRKKAQEFAEKKADEERKKVEIEMKDMQERLEKSEKEQQEAKKKELEFMKKQRELEDKEKNFEFEMEKKLFEERKKIETALEEKLKENSKKEFDEKLEKAQEEFRKKELEYQKQQEQMKKSLDDAQRKAEQGSQQIQGDIGEEDLKNALSQAFPIDSIEDVATGIKGADLIQTVKNNIGQFAGIIVWESKNTKSWTDSWIMKLKDDKLKANGNIAILVSSVLPKGLKDFGMLDDVMVCLPTFAIPVATMLRDKLISISKVEKSLEGKDIKMEMLYKYLSSEEFSSKISMMVDVFSQLKMGIDSERRAMEKNWKKREKDLERATFAITGMYGELESLMGQALPGAERLQLGYGEEDDDLED
ncbi:MAG: DUF2130 domain-containing protein [Candidatus Gracilibacteria bacterium]|nr:DUF2130 domain-containing protein [Candidatus Gracilibacteria bacterium]